MIEVKERKAVPLERAGKRHTRQRDAILKVIREARGPLGVTEILNQAKVQYPRLGIATVYRTVRLLLDAKQILAVVMPTGETRYEVASLGHHHHFLCRVCNRVYDFELCPVTMDMGPLLPKGFVADDHALTVFGTCATCRAN